MLYVNLPQSKKYFSIIYDMKYSSYASKKGMKFYYIAI